MAYVLIRGFGNAFIIRKIGNYGNGSGYFRFILIYAIAQGASHNIGSWFSRL